MPLKPWRSNLPAECELGCSSDGEHCIAQSPPSVSDKQEPAPNPTTHEKPPTHLKIIKKFSCSECGKIFATNTKLVRHQIIHTGEKPYSCPKCNKCFNVKRYVIEHQRVHTGEKPYSCPECGKCFSFKSNYTVHQKLHAGEKLYSCPECEKCFLCNSKLLRHQKSHIKKQIPKEFPCPECGKNFVSNSKLVKHQIIHTELKPFSCPDCGKCFRLKRQAVEHRRVHTGEKPYSCPECGKCFSFQSNFVVHQKLHRGEKPYSCAECGMCFVSSSKLVRHQRSHTGEKPFSCPECEKCFTRKVNLDKHRRSHMREMPYPPTYSRTIKSPEPLRNSGESSACQRIHGDWFFFLMASGLEVLEERPDSRGLLIWTPTLQTLTPPACSHDDDVIRGPLFPVLWSLLACSRCLPTDPHSSYQIILHLLATFTMAEQILGLTLEIIYLLTGEDYMVVKKPGMGVVTSSDPRNPPRQSMAHPRDNEQKILEVVNKILQMLTGEVPIRCQDVTVHLSLEEWEYLEEHKDQYKGVMMEDDQLLTTLDESSRSDIHDQPPTPQDVPLELWCYDVPPDCDLGYNVDGEHFLTPGLLSLTHPGDLSSDPTMLMEPPTQSQISKRFQCPECGKFFISHSKLMRHRIMHTGEKPFSCPECEKCFKGRRHLLDHLKIHSGEKAHSCPQCDKRFSYKSNLIIHLRSHTGEKPYSCAECGKCFVSNSKLVRHQRIHMVEKPFSCTECEKCFSYKTNLIVHQRVHTGEKPYSCSECGKCFVSSSKLGRHQRIHIGKKLYSCPECGKCFAHKTGLTRHQRSHMDQALVMSRMWEMSFTCADACTLQNSHVAEAPSCLEYRNFFPTS
ncbi:uncharacterized protein LOC142185529 [Leptodactylus fuscus]|uniref:uncharacterized protein LOC142185529 n=1 Tax=Leptodactylus fuscus TaxID=238119 RepID=UPI003F4EA8A3